VRNLPILGREKDPFPTNPRKDFKSFMGRVGGGKVPPSIERRRPLAKSARGDGRGGHSEGFSPRNLRR